MSSCSRSMTRTRQGFIASAGANVSGRAARDLLRAVGRPERDARRVREVLITGRLLHRHHRAQSSISRRQTAWHFHQGHIDRTVEHDFFAGNRRQFGPHDDHGRTTLSRAETGRSCSSLAFDTQNEGTSPSSNTLSQSGWACWRTILEGRGIRFGYVRPFAAGSQNCRKSMSLADGLDHSGRRTLGQLSVTLVLPTLEDESPLWRARASCWISRCIGFDLGAQILKQLRRMAMISQPI